MRPPSRASDLQTDQPRDPTCREVDRRRRVACVRLIASLLRQSLRDVTVAPKIAIAYPGQAVSVALPLLAPENCAPSPDRRTLHDHTHHE